MEGAKDAKRTCEDCKYCILNDYGYSSYTTEGTEFHCAVRVHPDGKFDRFYGEDARLEHAGNCPRFEEGDSIRMDVDRELWGDLSPEQRLIWDVYGL